MKPKNSKERRNSFFKFFLLFLFTVATIIFAIYFNYKVPTQENTILKQKFKLVEKDLEFQKEFTEEMNSIKTLMDSLDVPGTQKAYINSLISKKLVDLQTMIPTKDSTYKYDMYKSIVHLNIDIQKYKGRLFELRDAEEKIKECTDLLEKCNNNYDQALRDLDNVRLNN